MEYSKKIDEKWQKVWEDKKCFEAKDDTSKEKFYGLIEFPYPSGAGLHVGHVRAFMGMEVQARKKRLEGKNVLFPIGFDAFGLPTENYAMKMGIHPRKVTDQNIATFTKQLKSVGFSFDWSRVIDTTDPDYFKWTQWIFLKLFEKGLAYKAKTYVNYCPKCRVVLANEESQGGKCDRCDNETTQLEKEVWMLKITDYADKLLEELNNLDFPDRVKMEQENWIGKSEGAEIDFGLDGINHNLKVYTTRPDTIYGVTYMVIAPEHKIIEDLKDNIKNYDEVLKYKQEAKKKTEFERVELAKDKTGVRLEGINAINPVTLEKLPIYVADYVMTTYGTGAIMAVPAHDTRDYDFAKKYGLPIKQVVSSNEVKVDLEKEAYTDIKTGVMINSDILNGLSVEQAKIRIKELLQKNGIGVSKTNYHMKDWAFARQRYWGEPVPIVKCEKCGLVPLREEDLPLKLPEVTNFVPGEDGMSPLAKIDSFVNTTCPKCGGHAVRETDTMPQWAGSSWYFLRYIDPKNNNEIASMDKMKYWLPVDHYNGGMEHVTRHLIYSRFWHRFLYDIGIVPTKEPYAKRTYQGLILGPDGEKMSKSKGNVINPDDIVNKYGADTLRAYTMFIGDYTMAAPWSENGVKGVRKFLDRVLRLENFATSEKIESKELEIELHKTIKKVSEDIDQMKYNTAIAAMMSYVNVLYKQEKVWNGYIKPLIILLNPIAPHITEELWELLNFGGYVFEQKWPTFDSEKLVSDTITLPVQINGVFRYTIEIEATTGREDIISLVSNDERTLKYLQDKEIKNVIVVPGKIVNVIIK